MCMLAASVVMVGCSANTMSTAPTASPMTTTAAPTNSPMATAEATAEPAPAATMEAMTPAQAGQLAEKIAQAVQQISEIDEAQVVVNNDRALVAVRFDAQYNAGLDDRMKQQITETVQKVDDGLKDVEITDDDTLYGQIKGLGERVANVTGLDELADDFGDLWDRIVVPFFALRLIQMQVERDVERNAYRGGDGGRGRFWSGWRSAECSCNRQCQAFSAKKPNPFPSGKRVRF